MNVLCLGSEIVGPVARARARRRISRCDLQRRRPLRRAPAEGRRNGKGDERWRMTVACMSSPRAGSRSGSTRSRATSSSSGELKRMMKDDAVTGVTSNPTIFQKALSQGDAYDEQTEGAARRDRRRDGDLLLARARGHPRRVRRAEARLRRVRTAPTATSRWRSSRGSPTTPRRRSSRRAGSHKEVDRPNLMVKIPATHARPAGDRGLHRARHVDQHHADLLARSLQGGRRGVPARARAARRGRRRSVEGRVGRVVLRLARRHRGRQAPRGGRATRSCRASSRSRTRSSRTSTTSRRSPARAGSTSRARARRSSAASGRRRRPRTRRTAT